MNWFVILPAIFIFASRLSILRRMWRLPLKNGEGFFLGQQVAPGFYSGAGQPLFGQYHRALFIPLTLDLPLALWFIATGSFVFLFFEQFLACLANVVMYNLMIVHYTVKAAPIAGIEDERPTTSLQLSMSPRRLRDHTNYAIETIIAATVLVSLAALGRLLFSTGHLSLGHAGRGGVIIMVWILYVQIGLMLLKVVFVRWRMPLPMRRTEEFKLWRSEWLKHHLRIFDSIRLLSALVLILTMISINFQKQSRVAMVVGIAGIAIGVTVYWVYVAREGRRLAAVIRELKPVELVKEFPRRPVAEGRFLAGGLLYFNRDNPVVLVRSTQGIAINLAHPSTYLWAGYFAGLALLMAWMGR